MLIPKKLGASDIKSFRPISPMNGVYKIISTDLVNHLSEVLGKIVSKPHNALLEANKS